ncbi:nucleotide exchange factor GrpE [Candidatus Latescibacterota bacterium]
MQDRESVEGESGSASPAPEREVGETEETADGEGADGRADGEPGEEEDAEKEVDPLDQARTEAAANYDRYLRAAAELENFRKRMVRQRTETREEAVRDVVQQVAPLLDNMRRAVAQDTADAESLRQGIELIIGQFQSILKGYGLEEIEAVGKPFDPNFHEAVMEVPSSDHEPGVVMEEMEKGFLMRGKVVRPSRVIVSKAVEEAE